MDIALKPKKGATSPISPSIAVRFKGNFNNNNNTNNNHHHHNKNNKRTQHQLQTGPKKIMDKKPKASNKKDAMNAAHSDNENNGTVASTKPRNKSTNCNAKCSHGGGGGNGNKNANNINFLCNSQNNTKISKQNNYEKSLAIATTTFNHGAAGNSGGAIGGLLDIEMEKLCLHKSKSKTTTSSTTTTPNHKQQHNNKHLRTTVLTTTSSTSSTASTAPTAQIGTLAAAANAAVNKMKKSMLSTSSSSASALASLTFTNSNQISTSLPSSSCLNTSTSTPTTSTALAALLTPPTNSSSLALATLSTASTTAMSSTALVPVNNNNNKSSSANNTSELQALGVNNQNNGSAVTISNHNYTNYSNNNNTTNKNYQVPSDVLDDLATRFIINVPDIELSNLIRICFQIELAHWFYLDFFCDGGGVANINTNTAGSSNAIGSATTTVATAATTTVAELATEPVKVLQPLGIKYFAIQLFKHIPFLSEHLPSIDKILEDWKNYKLSVPTYGAILISEDLQYCLLVQSYFAKTSWGFPKGKVNETEDPEHCATREVFEETGFDITNLIKPKDYIETVLNYQYTRLYIVCNVSLNTVFSPQTRKEIRACNWFPIDCLPNNKNDAISKVKLGQNANSFFMILPFVKRLKKWVNEKRAQAGVLTTTVESLEVSSCNIVVNSNCSNSINCTANNISTNNNNSNNKTNQSRKYSNGCQLTSNNSNGATAAATAAAGTGAIPKSPAVAYVGDVHFMKSTSKTTITTTAASGGKKQQRQQQQQQLLTNNTNQNNSNNNNNRNRKNNTNNSNNSCNNVAGIFKLSDVESSTFAAAASAAANACLKRQRHKSMGDLDNMKLHNNNMNNNPNLMSANQVANNQSTSCNKNYKNQQQRQQIQQQQQQQQSLSSNSGKRNSNQKLQGSSNGNNKEQEKNLSANGADVNVAIAASYSNGSIRRQLFHSQSQNDCGNFMGALDENCIEAQIANTFDLIRQQQQQYANQQQKKPQQSDELLNFVFEASEISVDGVVGMEDRSSIKVNDGQAQNRKQHMRQRAKSQSDKQHQQQEPQQKQVCFFNSNMISALSSATSPSAATASSLSNHHHQQQHQLQSQRSMVFTKTTTSIAGQEIENAFAATAAMADIKIDNTNKMQQNIGALTAEQHFSAFANIDGTHERSKTAQTTATLVTPTALTAKLASNAVIEASAIETRLIQEQRMQKMLQNATLTTPRMATATVTPQKSVLEMPTTSRQQHQSNPLQHSASSPGLATWKNFSFTKNLISNVFL